MPTLSIPGAIVDNLNLNPTEQVVFAKLFEKLKKGDKVELTQGALLTGNLTETDLVSAIRGLVVEGYARVEERDDRLEDMVAEQTMRLTVHVHAEILPLYPTDEASVTRRRYPHPSSDDVPWDYAKVGRMIYRATLSGMTGLFEGEYSLTVRARHGDVLEQAIVIDKMTFRKESEAWAFFDGWVRDVRDKHERGEILPGAAGENAGDAALIAALIALGYDRADGERATAATTEELDEVERFKRAISFLGGDPVEAALNARRIVAGAASDFHRAAAFAMGAETISIAELKDALGINHQRAIVVLGELHKAGVIDDMGNPRSKVLMSGTEISTMLEGRGDGE